MGRQVFLRIRRTQARIVTWDKVTEAGILQLENIGWRIYLIWDKRVMLDQDPEGLHGVRTLCVAISRDRGRLHAPGG
jgi:hypothetical protein